MKLDRDRMVAAAETAMRAEMEERGATQRQSKELMLVHKPALRAFAAMIQDAFDQKARRWAPIKCTVGDVVFVRILLHGEVENRMTVESINPSNNPVDGDWVTCVWMDNGQKLRRGEFRASNLVHVKEP